MDKKDKERLNELRDHKIDQSYIYIEELAKYYNYKYRRFYNGFEVCSNLILKPKDLLLLREGQVLKSYKRLCYCRWGIKWCFNLLDESKILLPSDNPHLDINIKRLIENVCGFNKENIEYLHKLILYKYVHVNDFNVPAVIFYWAWWSGKWTIVSLFWTIFWEDNILANLGQWDLDSNFSSYQWWKLIVEYAEVSTNSISQDIKNLNKLKNQILAPKIMVNCKWVHPYEVENIALFIISSNSEYPLRLDSKDKGNRRFSVIKSLSSLSSDEWMKINKAIRNKETVSNYLWRLLSEFPEIIEVTSISALDNKDKADLESKSETEANDFWEWYFEKYPNSDIKIPLNDIYVYMDTYANEMWIESLYEFKKYFWKGSKYQKRKIRIWDKTCYGVHIVKSLEH